MRLFEVYASDLLWLAVGVAIGVLVFAYYGAFLDPSWYAPQFRALPPLPPNLG